MTKQELKDSIASVVKTNGENEITGDNLQAKLFEIIDECYANSLLPSQTGNSGKYLTTDGTNTSWATVSAGATYTFSTGLTNTTGTVTANLSTGKAGGQSVIGGTASGENLTLSSTSNATKGKILFGTSAYDEVNNRLGIGVTSPTSRLHLPAGTATAGTSPLKFTSGTNLTTPEAGAMEYDGTSLYFSPSTTRRTVVLDTATQTLTNKRINPRVQAVTSASTVTPSADNDDEVVITAQGAALTLANWSGTPVQGQAIIIRIKDDSTARAITFDTLYRAVGAYLPTTTVIGKTVYIACIYNSTDTKIDVVSVAQEI